NLPTDRWPLWVKGGIALCRIGRATATLAEVGVETGLDSSGGSRQEQWKADSSRVRSRVATATESPNTATGIPFLVTTTRSWRVCAPADELP
ncbi:MAG: hypothetical protein QNL12_02500, partial [Acidimicrobiia bacterium]|nr:hypothetical protein [Acidimicrobiia bacterium]